MSEKSDGVEAPDEGQNTLAKPEPTAVDEFKTDAAKDGARIISLIARKWINPLVKFSRDESERGERAFTQELEFANKELQRQHAREQLKTWFTGLGLLVIVGGAVYLFATGRSQEGMYLLTFLATGGFGIAWGRLQERNRDTEIKRKPDGDKVDG